MVGKTAQTNAAATPKYTQMGVQTSAYGVAISVIYGRTRTSVQLLWEANFRSVDINNPSSGGGGKGGIAGGGGKGCVAGETLISTPSGPKRIDQIRVGDKVWSRDPETGLVVPGTVTDVLKHSVADTGDKMLKVFLRERDTPLHLTTNHYPWIDGKLKREIADFRWEDTLLGEDGDLVRISHMLRAPDVEYTWNLVVEPHHNFFAEGVLLHNGGGGGGGKGSTTTNYFVDVLVGICEGVINGVDSSWISQTLVSGAPGFDVIAGAIGQSPWTYLVDNYPGQALSYSGTAIAGAASLPLGTSANFPAIAVEIQGIFAFTSPSTYDLGGDADPSLVVPDILSNGQYGIGFPANRVGQVSMNDEPHAVPGSGPFTVTVTNHAGFLYGINVVDTIVGGVGTNLYTCVSGSPGPLQYSFNPATGVYTFNAAQAGVTVNVRYASLGALTTYQNWCLASGLWISPAYEDQAQTSSVMDDIATATYSDFVWTSGVLTLVPRGTQNITANGFTYTAPSTAIFDLGVDDFLPNTNATGTVSGAANDDPVIVSRLRASDQYNDIKIEAVDRANDYAPTIVEATDQALIDKFQRRASPPKSLHMFADIGAANISAQLQLQDQNIRNNYSIELDARYCVLDPADLITLTDPDYSGLTKTPARITNMVENDDGSFSVISEDWLGSIGVAATYALNVGSGFTPNFNVDPGPVNTPQIFAPPPAIADNQALEIWVAVSGSNQTSYGGAQAWIASASGGPYKLVGQMTGESRMGITAADFAVGSDPDTVNTLNVDLSESAGILETGTSSDADQDNTLCLVRGTNGDEYVSYSNSSLTGTNKYALGTYLRRGQLGSVIVDHPSGSPFVRIDQLLFKIPYTADQIGQTVYLKFPSVNIYGGGIEDLSVVTAYPIVLPAPPAPPDVAGFGASQVGSAVAFAWDTVDYPLVALVGYLIAYAPQGTSIWSDFKLITESAAGTEMTNADIPAGTWTFAIRAANIAYIPGSGIEVGLSPDMSTFDLTVTNVNEVIYDNDEASTRQSSDGVLPPASGGWGGTISGFILHYTGVLIPDDQNTVSHYTSATAYLSTALGSSPVPTPVATSTYTTGIIDTGFVSNTRVFDSVTPQLLPGNSGAAATVNFLIDDWSTGSDPNTFNPWTIGYVTFRFLRARITYSASAGNVSFIQHFTPHLDTAPSTETADNQVISAGGTTVTFPISFHVVPEVVATPVASTALYATATNITTTQATIHVWNSSGVDVGGTVNYTATGE